MTMRSVARCAGVSTMTVSNAFSRPERLSSGLRTRILAVAAEMGYAGPDPAARSLVRGRTGIVAILQSETPQYAFHDEYSAIWLSTLSEELGCAGLALTLLPTRPAPSFVPARDVAMDGAIVHSTRPATDGVEWLRRRGLPLVYVDQAGEPAHSSVNIDDRSGAAEAARHIVELGHRRIGLVPLGRAGFPEESDDWFVARQRLAGWYDGLDGTGAVVDVVPVTASTFDAGLQAAGELLDRTDRLTAVLCFCDAVAAGVVRAAYHRGLAVPRDLSVVGFDDTPLARRTLPGLTTVHQDIEGKGRAAAGALVRAIARHRGGDGDAGTPEHVVLPTALTIRSSTASAP